MKPALISAADTLVEKAMSGILAAVDCNANNNLMKRFNVKGFPSIKYFKDGEKVFDALNLRDEDSILNFLANPKESLPQGSPETPWAEMQTNVVHLTLETFKAFLRKTKHVLVMFYSPLCSHCKKTKLHFTLTAAYFADDPKVKVAAVDCTEEIKLCSDSNISAIPTFQYFQYFNKKETLYEGDRTHTAFIAFLNQARQGREELWDNKYI